jgi:hypothetical protein
MFRVPNCWLRVASLKAERERQRPNTAGMAHQFGSQDTAAISLSSRRSLVQDSPPVSLR